MFDHQAYLKQFLTDYQAGKFYNNSYALVERTTAKPAYRIIGIHHLTGDENRGNHNLFIDVVDGTGKRKQEQIKWGWEGQRINEHPNPVVLDKPANEPSGNISIGKNQIVWAKVLGKDSDIISNVMTLLPDEASGNTLGHHSHYVVWLWDENTIPETEPPKPPADCSELQAQVKEAKELMIKALAKLEGVML